VEGVVGVGYVEARAADAYEPIESVIGKCEGAFRSGEACGVAIFVIGSSVGGELVEVVEGVVFFVFRAAVLEGVVGEGS